jgi:inorganic pyrophosphatase
MRFRMKITAVVEIPQGSCYKYEVDKETGALTIDRPLNQPVPYNYGFIPNTLCDDGDALDVFVMTEDPIVPLTRVKIVPVAVLKCTDNGKGDDKIIATLEGDPYPESGISIISTYLTSYKTGFVVNSIGDEEEAKKVYKASVHSFYHPLEKNETRNCRI